MSEITSEDIENAIRKVMDTHPSNPVYILPKASYDRVLKEFPEIVLLNNIIVSENLPDDIDGVIYNG